MFKTIEKMVMDLFNQHEKKYLNPKDFFPGKYAMQHFWMHQESIIDKYYCQPGCTILVKCYSLKKQKLE